VSTSQLGSTEGVVFDIDSFAVHDGPGIRMAVYLKGCPLSCDWCHSPESQDAEPELVFMRDRCSACGACVDACLRGCHSFVRSDADNARSASRHSVAFATCVACGECVEVCPNRALGIKGERMAAEEVVRRAVRLKPFFAHSGGGVTLTGGEVCGQPDFACAVLDGCREAGIHTAVETSGFCDAEVIEAIAERSDLVLYDLKLADPIMHRRHTGASNEKIVGNLARLPVDRVVVRVPLIPGITDTEENVRAIAELAANAGITRVELLPYNPTAAAKYEWIGRSYAIDGTPQPDAVLDRLREIATDATQVSASIDR